MTTVLKAEGRIVWFVGAAVTITRILSRAAIFRTVHCNTTQKNSKNFKNLLTKVQKGVIIIKR